MTTTHQTTSVTLRRGQAFSWHESPCGIAQIDELLRRNVVIGWRVGRSWRIRRVPVSAVVRAMKQSLITNTDNPFDRGVRPANKTFHLEVQDAN